MIDKTDDLALLELIAGQWQGVAPAADRKEAMRQKLMREVRGAEPPQGSFTLRQNEGDWIEFSPTIKMKKLVYDERDNVVTVLLKLLPGAEFPEHLNTADEECLVLEGAIKFGDHVVNAGDFHYMAKGNLHPVMTSDHGALVYLRTRFG
ncbi:MAG TPA: cupin domain-containing protein [Pseudomonadales bacterium]|nr:cupin domain-containing protein [Pseudomonadales bacterium]